MKRNIEKLTQVGIPIAKRFRTLGYNVRANIDKDDEALLFEMRDFHKQLRFNIDISTVDIIRSIKHFIDTNTNYYIEDIVNKRQAHRLINNQEIITNEEIQRLQMVIY